MLENHAVFGQFKRYFHITVPDAFVGDVVHHDIIERNIEFWKNVTDRISPNSALYEIECSTVRYEGDDSFRSDYVINTMNSTIYAWKAVTLSVDEEGTVPQEQILLSIPRKTYVTIIANEGDRDEIEAMELTPENENDRTPIGFPIGLVKRMTFVTP